MGTVYLAQDQRFQRRYVALKENLNAAPEARTQFRPRHFCIVIGSDENL
jgi:hypothetical protein